MRVEVLETLAQEDFNDLFRWRDRVFPVEGKGIEWAKPSCHIVCRNEDGMAVGHAGLGRFAIISAGKEMPVIGVGGVVVRPEYQGRGIPAKMFEVLHRGMPGFEEINCFTLFCPQRLEGYYARHGYRVYDGTVKVVQKEKLVTVDFSFMFCGDCGFGEWITITGEPW
ncbi:MAG TPA: GNAT family N-acetyltransferase [Gammaproteobacteria bacterium]